MELELGTWGILLVGAAAAGWIDAVIGGGGLVLIPLLLAVVPGLAPATALGTNKLVGVSGTTSAAWTLMRRVRPRLDPWYVVLAVVCAGGGALSASLIDAALLRPVIIVLLLAVGTFVALRPSFGASGAGQERAGAGAGRWRRWLVLVLVGGIAFYDGIFGPGTGMFLIMAFTAVLSQDFLRSAAQAKVVNTATNLGALVVFAVGARVVAARLVWRWRTCWGPAGCAHGARWGSPPGAGGVARRRGGDERLSGVAAVRLTPRRSF